MGTVWHRANIHMLGMAYVSWVEALRRVSIEAAQEDRVWTSAPTAGVTWSEIDYCPGSQEEREMP